MTILLRPIFAFLDLVRLESSPSRIATGLVLGMWIGLTPAGTLHFFLFLIAALVFSVNPVATFLSAVFCHEISPMLDPIFDPMGLYVLIENPRFSTLWPWLFHAPIVPFTRFYNSVVMGCAIFCILAAVPVFIVSKRLVTVLGPWVLSRLYDSRPWNLIRNSRFYALYVEYHAKG